MSSCEISEDEDDSFDPEQLDRLEKSISDDVVKISSDEETDNYFTSDEESELPAVNLASKKSAVIKNLFPTRKETDKSHSHTKPSHSHTKSSHTLPKTLHRIEPKRMMLQPPGVEKMIGGVKINMPLEPYPCQIALMFKVITAINKGQNCLLESPTGSGKTLALLCGALAWQLQEKNRLSKLQAQEYFSHHPELSALKGATEVIASPVKVNYSTPVKNNPGPPGDHGSPGRSNNPSGKAYDSPSKGNSVDYASIFKKTRFGERSIYDKPPQSDVTDDACFSSKRPEALQDSYEEASPDGLVTIHKRRKLDESDRAQSPKRSPRLPTTPERPITTPQPETPEQVRNLYDLVDNLQIRTSMLVHCSVPTIYYGARTHKQIQQVVKEFSRTWYSGQAPMSLLASRDYSCIREFDKQMWGTKNDMCRGCIKKLAPEGSTPKKNETNCVFYDNRQAMSHGNLPPAFDLEDLLGVGEELQACPYYAARAMAQVAQVVFCPYNYLIEPGIRKSMQINLRGNIVIIDEGHNIEDICRDAATFTFTRDKLQASIQELQIVADYRYANRDVLSYIDYLLKSLRNWDDWFGNQVPLVRQQPVNNNEAVHVWEVEIFVQTLNNHNIGEQQYREFSDSADMFCQRLRDDPRTLYGVTQATGTLVESLDTVLGYLFGQSGKYKDDFKPVLVRAVYGPEGAALGAWRNSQFNKSIDKDSLSLRLMCMNPAVIFEGLKEARCIILASGTLTPLVSLHSELATEFPLQISPNHVIPPERVWIGTLTTCPNGRPLECNSKGTDQIDVQDGIGQAVLWVCQVTPHGVLCFLPSYMLMNKLQKRWQESGIWKKLNDLKHVFMESRIVRDHNDIMEDYYKYVSTSKGALLFAVYRGKVSEGMDFKDHQARAVITVGVPYPNTFDMAVKEKMKYNDKNAVARKLLSSGEWLRVQAYRALNQAVGRCVRHRGDWGAVLLLDARFTRPYYTEHLSKWVRGFLGSNHHTFESLVNSPNSLESFMQNMTIKENEDVPCE